MDICIPLDNEVFKTGFAGTKKQRTNRKKSNADTMMDIMNVIVDVVSPSELSEGAAVKGKMEPHDEVMVEVKKVIEDMLDKVAPTLSFVYPNGEPVFRENETLGDVMKIKKPRKPRVRKPKVVPEEVIVSQPVVEEPPFVPKTLEEIMSAGWDFNQFVLGLPHLIHKYQFIQEAMKDNARERIHNFNRHTNITSLDYNPAFNFMEDRVEKALSVLPTRQEPITAPSPPKMVDWRIDSSQDQLLQKQVVLMTQQTRHAQQVQMVPVPHHNERTTGIDTTPFSSEPPAKQRRVYNRKPKNVTPKQPAQPFVNPQFVNPHEQMMVAGDRVQSNLPISSQFFESTY